MAAYPGKFITFEGMDGSGKSTQCAALAAIMARHGVHSLSTREPGGTEGAEQMRELLVRRASQRWEPMTEAFLHSAARREHVVKTILPALQRGEVVISDRFADSTIVYQGYGHELGEATMQMLYTLTTDLIPDLTFIFDIEPEEALKRAKKRNDNEDHYESLPAEFHQRVRKGFLTLAEAEPHRYIVLDSSMPEEQLTVEIIKALNARFGLSLSIEGDESGNIQVN